MQLTCPHCQFSKEVPIEKLPKEPTRVSCPQCKESFSFPGPGTERANRQSINCPVCDVRQPEAASCSSCGLIYARYNEAKQKKGSSPIQYRPEPLTEKPKAGFWLRAVALMIDCFLIFMIQVIFGVLLAFTNSSGFGLNSSMSVLVQIFSTVVSLFYWIFFTGYCGQTPGKMLLRIQVVTTDGAPLSYGKTFYREVIGKFLSGIIFAIGYLMAAFDDQKQGLHDRMAKTYVIKL
jgi:uncharacterized RDD family membrane protein YckC/transcription elongation factor Elf1